ncbi:MAG: methionine--tRNA ligase, partial [Halobacteriaceae archaeon]
SYSTGGAAEEMMELAQFGNMYIQREEPWNQSDEAAAGTIRDCLQIVQALAVLSYPVLPDAASRIWDQLNNDGQVSEVTIEAAFEKPGDTIPEPTELFNRIKDDHIETLNQKLSERVAEATESDSPSLAADIDPEVVDDLDLRVGEIKSAESIADGEPHLHFEIDVETDTLDVVAAIGDVHEPDALVGEQVVLVANMEPQSFHGVASEGLLLTVADSKEPLTPPSNQTVGTRIR